MYTSKHAQLLQLEFEITPVERRPAAAWVLSYVDRKRTFKQLRIPDPQTGAHVHALNQSPVPICILIDPGSILELAPQRLDRVHSGEPTPRYKHFN